MGSYLKMEPVNRHQIRACLSACMTLLTVQTGPCDMHEHVLLLQLTVCCLLGIWLAT